MNNKTTHDCSRPWCTDHAESEGIHWGTVAEVQVYGHTVSIVVAEDPADAPGGQPQIRVTFDVDGAGPVESAGAVDMVDVLTAALASDLVAEERYGGLDLSGVLAEVDRRRTASR